MSRTYDVLAIGHAIVDVLAEVPDSFLQQHAFIKGSMKLIDQPTAHTLYQAMPAAIETSGGSASNTIALLAALGGKGAFIGVVAPDQLGEIFTHDLHAWQVAYTPPPRTEISMTGRCLVAITPDAQRSMATYLGAAATLCPEDISETIIANTATVYIEGYLWDTAQAKAALKQTIDLCHKHNTRIAFSLSDPFCVERHHPELLNLIQHHIDILFCNEAEAAALCHQSNKEKNLRDLGKYCQQVILTCGAQGAMAIENGSILSSPAVPSGPVMDTTGAGDAFAAGYLYANSQQRPLAERLLWGNTIAGKIIAQIGARPNRPVATPVLS